MNLKNRLQKLREGLVEQEIDAILVSRPENRYYLSGFDGSYGYLLITQKNVILATDFRYTEQAEDQVSDCEIFRITTDIGNWFPKLTAELSLSRLGFESRSITFALHQQLADVLSETKSRLELVPLPGLIESLRAVKEPEEVESITRAIEITDAAFENIEDMVRVGMSEKEAAVEIEKFIRQNSSENVPFEVIVAAGPNAARPHAKPSFRKICPDEPVVIDMGARIEGYSSDLTRTLCLGTADDTFNRVYNIVLEAQLEAIDRISEGMTGCQADSLARKVIEKAGYGETFGHGLGHGIGLAVHEQPRLGPSSDELIVAGMVFTIEPGIYLTGWGGVRIEDDVIMENGKARVMSRARKAGRIA